jgi:cytochrome c-type biogenesis protein CcmH/NrfF
VLWLVPFAITVSGLVVLTVLANRVRREISPTVAVIDRFGREHRVALTTARRLLADETAATRRRLSSD